ncbi:hypothetical protein MTR67_033233 [Solanum verrucosum]|uniref:Uncharacterized protein n=1 Tax=Solanum verrucosum TaxID=315347 RepID=A0AAF0U5P1_SOLVR|nr:hypothetical protein MTR67_033233 [Solanum verrucosum]
MPEGTSETFLLNSDKSGEVCLCSEAAESGRISNMEADLCQHTIQEISTLYLGCRRHGGFLNCYWMTLSSCASRFCPSGCMLLFMMCSVQWEPRMREEDYIDNDETIGITRTSLCTSVLFFVSTPELNS